MLKYKKLHEDSIAPTKAHATDAGYDFYVHTIQFKDNEEHLGGDFWQNTNHVFVSPGEMVKIHTGIAVGLPEGCAGFLWDRSGMGSKEIHRLAGVIDQSYNGEIICLLYNLSSKYVRIDKGDKVIQMIVQKVESPELVEVSDLAPSERGNKGFGSSDIESTNE